VSAVAPMAPGATLLPSPARRRHEESDLQVAVMEFLDWALPADAVAHHSPGEGKRTKRAQGQLKRSGYKRGWPDVEIVWRQQSHPIFIELKALRGVVPETQRDMHRKLTYCGADVLLCRSVPGVECALRELGLPLKGSVVA
jgi:hypothetical protein